MHYQTLFTYENQERKLNNDWEERSMLGYFQIDSCEEIVLHSSNTKGMRSIS